MKPSIEKQKEAGGGGAGQKNLGAGCAATAAIRQGEPGSDAATARTGTGEGTPIAPEARQERAQGTPPPLNLDPKQCAEVERQLDETGSHRERTKDVSVGKYSGNAAAPDPTLDAQKTAGMVMAPGVAAPAVNHEEAAGGSGAGSLWTAEKELAGELGLPRAELAKLRGGLREGEDWARNGNLIVWLKAGIDRLRGLLRGKEGADPLEETQKEEPPPAPQILLVAAIVTNRRVVLAQREGPEGRPMGEKITVRNVKDNRLLTPKQRILATPDRHGPVWNWYGRHPKRRGELLVPKVDGQGRPISLDARTPLGVPRKGGAQ